MHSSSDGEAVPPLSVPPQSKDMQIMNPFLPCRKIKEAWTTWFWSRYTSADIFHVGFSINMVLVSLLPQYAPQQAPQSRLRRNSANVIHGCSIRVHLVGFSGALLESPIVDYAGYTSKSSL